MAERVKSEIGYINLLITNAGMSGPMLESLKPRYTLSDFVSLAWGSPMEDFNAVYGLNCTALYYTVIAFLELLDAGNKKGNYAGGKSQVIATASTASFLRNPRAGYAYLSSKAAVISLMKSFSTFCVPWGIRFNAIAAGCEPSTSLPRFYTGLTQKIKYSPQSSPKCCSNPTSLTKRRICSRRGFSQERTSRQKERGPRRIWEG
jgi:NAD(P)-dependent dehydrogenase (short-subunit alcohol dehydrogenase family)